LNYRISKFLLGFATDCLQKVRFTQTRIAVNKKRIIGITWRLTYRNTACMSKAIARAYYKIAKGIIGMEFKLRFAPSRTPPRFFAGLDIEIYSDKMAGYLLSGTRKTAFAIVT